MSEISKPIVGFHVSKSGRTMDEALAAEMGALGGVGFDQLCAQIFVMGPQNTKETLSTIERLAVRNFIADIRANVVIHSAYVNSPWSGEAFALHNIKREMRIATEIGASGVIVHLGKNAHGDILRKVITQLAKPVPLVTLWLEINAAKSSQYTFETPEKINALFKQIDKINSVLPAPLKVGLCIDTAHLWSCGVSMASRESAEKWLGTLNMISNHPVMFHLNDSSAVFGSGIDRHEGLTSGNIWGAYKLNGHLPIKDSGLIAVLEWAAMHGSIIILERNPAQLMQDLALIRDLGYN